MGTTKSLVKDPCRLGLQDILTQAHMKLLNLGDPIDTTSSQILTKLAVPFLPEVPSSRQPPLYLPPKVPPSLCLLRAN